MRLTKIQREQIRMKFGGVCAYCGKELPARWHVDHKDAVVRDHFGINKGKMMYPENDTINNLMPSCPPCNISKHSLSIEAWRKWLAGHMRSLNEHHSIYRLMLAYGCVIETDKPIIFHFEKIKELTK